MKIVQIRSYFWSVFSRIRTEYGHIQSECGEIRTRNNSVFGHFSHSEMLRNEFWCNYCLVVVSFSRRFTAQKMKFSINDFFSKCQQIRRKVRIWSHSLKKSLMENFIFCAGLSFVIYSERQLYTLHLIKKDLQTLSIACP